MGRLCAARDFLSTAGTSPRPCGLVAGERLRQMPEMTGRPEHSASGSYLKKDLAPIEFSDGNEANADEKD